MPRALTIARCLLPVACCLVHRAAQAQTSTVGEPSFSVERFTPAPGHAAFGVVEDPDVLPHLRWAASLWTSVMSRPIVLRDLITGEEATTPVRLSAQTNPDYRQEQEGAKPGGRMVEPVLFDSHRVPEAWRRRIRPPQFYGALRLEEVMRIYAPSLKPEKIPADLVADRVATGIVAAGQALVHMLVLGCLEAGVELRTGVAVRALTTARGRVRRGRRTAGRRRARRLPPTLARAAARRGRWPATSSAGCPSLAHRSG